MTFEETGNLRVPPRRGRKLVSTESVKEVPTAVSERASTSIYSSASGRSVPRELEIPWSTVRKILRYILKWYPYKIHLMPTLKAQGHKIRVIIFNSRYTE
ncbi:hypothetical protein TNCV_1223401 [Trichonephila clavipes]|nr:hypothetical protein TNCV_1223401 [Trichonephila clavipes]